MFKCLFILLMMYVYVQSCFSHAPLLATLWSVADQTLLSMGILQARMMEWLATPSLLGDLSDPGIEPVSPVAPALQEDSLPLNLWGSHENFNYLILFSYHNWSLHPLGEYTISFTVLKMSSFGNNSSQPWMLIFVEKESFYWNRVG